MQRTLEDFQFDLETALTMSRLAVWKPREERDATILKIEILQNTAGKKDCSRSVGGARRGSRCWQQTRLDMQELMCERTLAPDVLRGLGPDCERGLVRTQERPVSMLLFKNKTSQDVCLARLGQEGPETSHNFLWVHKLLTS